MATAAPTAESAPAVRGPVTETASGTGGDGSVGTAAATFASHLAATAGLGGMVGAIQRASTLIGDFVKLSGTLTAPHAVGRSTAVSMPSATSTSTAVAGGDDTKVFYPDLPASRLELPEAPDPSPIDRASPAAGRLTAGPKAMPPITAAAEQPIVAELVTAAPPIQSTVATAGRLATTAASVGSAAGGPSAAAAGVVGAASATGAAGAASAVGPLAGLVAAAGPVGIGLAAVAAASTAAVVGIKMFGNVVQDQAQKLDAYSPSVSMAVSESELRQEMAMFRRAETVGPDVAKWERLRGEASERLADITTQLLKFLFDVVERWEPEIKSAVAALGIVPPALEGMGKAAEAALEFFTGDFLALPDTAKEFADAQKKLLKAVHDWIDDQNPDPKTDKYMDEFFETLPLRMAADRRGMAPGPPRHGPGGPLAGRGPAGAAGALAGAGGP